MRDECEHGRLRRACPECHAAEDIAELNAEIDRLRARVAEMEADGAAPIARLTVDADGKVTATLYAPGLPEGEHDVWCVPVSERESLALLDAECAGLKAELDDWRRMAGRLRAALEAEAQDAARYRWLRREAYVWGADHVPKQVEPAALWIKGNVGMDDAGIDEAIDTTRAEALK